MSNFNNEHLTSASIPTSSQTGGFAAAGGAQPHGSSSLASSTGLGGSSAAFDSTTTPTPITPATYNAINQSSAPNASAQSPSHSSSATSAAGISSFGNAAGNHPHHSEPNIPATAQSLAAKAPSAEEIKQRGAQLVDQTAEMAQQAREKAGEFVNPKEKDELNPAEKHVDNLAGGIAGMVLTAPLAAVEKVSPVVADKLSAAASAASVQFQDAANKAGPVAQSYAQQAVDAARNVLPAALGGRPAETDHVGASTSTTTTTSTGPTVTDRAASAGQSASQTASNAAASVQQTATSAAQSAQATLASAAQTAAGYLPTSIANKLPGGVTSTETGAASTGTGSSSTESPYVARDEIKSNPLPSSTLQDLPSASSKTSDLHTGASSTSGYTGLAPSSTSSSGIPTATSTSSAFSAPSHSAGPAAHGGEHTSSTLDSRSTQPSSVYSSGNVASESTNQKSVYEDPSLASSTSARKTQREELHPSSSENPSTEYNDGQGRATQLPGATLGGSSAVSYEKAPAALETPTGQEKVPESAEPVKSSSIPSSSIVDLSHLHGSDQLLAGAERVESRPSAPTAPIMAGVEPSPASPVEEHQEHESSLKKEGLRSRLSKLIHPHQKNA